jgi:DNA-binding transcriptional regulator YhcF (GntR family)
MSIKRINHFYVFVDRLTDLSGRLRNIDYIKLFIKSDLQQNSAQQLLFWVICAMKVVLTFLPGFVISTFTKGGSVSERGVNSMMEQEKPASRQTKHRRVFEHVLADIESGKLKEGERLPSEMELVKEFATSRPTVARALRDLQNLGLVERKVGSGTYVRKSQKPVDLWRFGLLIPGLGGTEILSRSAANWLAWPRGSTIRFSGAILVTSAAKRTRN